MGSWRRWILAPALLLVVLAACDAIYEDQVGLWDWHQEYIGKVTHAVFQTASGKKRVIVATEKSVVASLNLRSGEIFWRQVLEESEPIDGLQVALGKYAVSLSRGGSLRSFHLPDGSLIWETSLYTSPSPAQLFLLPSDDLLVLKQGIVYVVSSADGRLLWTSDLLDERLAQTSLSFEGKNIYVAGFSGSSLALFRIDASTGAFTTLKTTEPLNPSSFVLSSGVFAALDTQGNIVTGLMEAEVVELQKTSLATLLDSPVSSAQLLPDKIPGGCVLSTDGGSIFVLGLDKKGVEVLQQIQGPPVVSNSIVLDGTFAQSFLQHINSKEIRVRVLSGKEWIETAEETVEVDPNKGGVQKVFMNAYIKTDRSRGFRVLIVGQDHSLALLQQGKVVWSREEALASVVDTLTAELPLEKAGVSVAEVEHDLYEWLKGHVLRLKSTLMLATAEEQTALQALRLNNADKTKMTRDHNGFRKLIVVLTSSGKLFALHTGNGGIVWSRFIPELSTKGSLKLYPWRIPHKHVDENAVALVLGSSHDGTGFAAWVDMLTGSVQETLALPYSVKVALALPVVDSSERRLHLLIDDQNKAHLYPTSDESLSLFEKYMQNVYFYIADKEAGQIEGYNIKSQVDAGEEGGLVFQSQKIWSVLFPKDSETIAAITTRRADEMVHTQAKVLGNRDVWYKYLNKNMVFVATVTPQDSRVGAANPEETWLVAYLIDSVTGQILHRVSHAHAQGPVHVVFSENWVVYCYFNVRNHRHEMSVLEVYDKSADGKDVLQLMLGRYNASVPFSSFSPRNLEVKGQSYFFPSTVRTMSVTFTARGITGKQILVGTIGNQVIALDKRFLDPRRSADPTPMEREEGVIPLSEGLPLFPQSYLTHAARVEELRGIISVPARLESTCLVFAYGIDLFFTRTAPSRTYDSLTEDFSYALLLITIVVLVVAIAVSMVLSQRKELREKWK
ncbi:ER membrane protein complex subunit 1 [Selaginella moellendorffii]|uniref:ER membrane protein complex subunit 1 n=1 Tax=Selaginella moellendorffii TaxID=88036 RepID=UPI000D1C3C12|nr:ER membrane protein complex subunit 1 [Selaginella moellendorffii]|eukprot:XP_024544147.1 ER membrane protein complex subunit 1 [Selaginella moellendorffii]